MAAMIFIFSDFLVRNQASKSAFMLGTSFNFNNMHNSGYGEGGE